MLPRGRACQLPRLPLRSGPPLQLRPPADFAGAGRGRRWHLPVQTLGRPLMPGEVPLDELERAFRETEVEKPAARPVARPTPSRPRLAPAAIMPASSRGGCAGARRRRSAEDNHGGVASQSIRVNVDALDHLMTMISELVLTRNQLIEIARRQEDPEYKISLQRLSTVTAELQEAVMRTRMQPIGNAWQKLPRVVRDLSKDLNKPIELLMVGADTELDRQVLDLIKDPLTHMVRNSADHGLEMPEERRRLGKPEKGLIRLSAYHEGGHIIIEITDDGRGLDIDKIRAKALEKRLGTEAELAKMTDAQISRFIFHAGFSTSEKVTSVSGRGVGMDVVRTNIDLIGGSADVRSKRGQGSTFTIKIPLTLAIVPALIVEAAGERFAIPQLAVVELVRIQANSETRVEKIKGAPVLRLRDELLPIVHLSRLLGIKGAAENEKVEDGFIAVMQVGHQTFGIVVNAVFHTEEIVIKPMSSMLRQIPMFSGSTILGDGRVILIIDPNGIAQAAAGSIDQGPGSTPTPSARRASRTGRKRSPSCSSAPGPKSPRPCRCRWSPASRKSSSTKIEHSGGRPVVLYRGSLIPLVHVEEPRADRPKRKTQPMLVFSENGRTMGLLVDQIVDIVEEKLHIELPSEVPGFLGAAIIGERATEVLDISHFVALAFNDWFERKAETHAGHRGRLLLIDDSAFFRDLIHPILAGIGYHVVPCGSLAEARERLAGEDGFDAIVADIDMPQMKAPEFVAEIRADTRFPRRADHRPFRRPVARRHQPQRCRRLLRPRVEVGPRSIDRGPYQDTPSSSWRSGMTKPVLNPEGMATSDGQYVTVRIGGQLFGLPITSVHEVFAPQRITPVPLAPAEIRGALNLRGRIVTMIDMHRLLGVAPAEKHVNMAAGIELKGESFGLIIDEVGEVLSLDSAKFETSSDQHRSELGRAARRRLSHARRTAARSRRRAGARPHLRFTRRVSTGPSKWMGTAMKTCLVVDDSGVVRKIARRILEQLAFDVSEAGDGKEALDRCIQAMPDAVLLDWNMPVMDGPSFLRELRGSAGGPRRR